MRRAYTLKWNLFVEWCSSHQEDPRRCSIRAVLSFLQQRLERRLSPTTLKVYVAAISTHHDPVEGKSVGKHNLVVRFLRGARRLNPPRPPSLPSWDLALVLRALVTAPFEPLQSVELKFLSMKTLLLTALASIKRVGDLQAFSVDDSCLEFGPADSSATLRPRPGYVPKVPTTPFRDQISLYITMNNPSAHPSYSHYYLLSPSTMFFLFFVHLIVFCTSCCFFAHLFCTSYCLLHILLFFAHLIVLHFFYFIAHFTLISPFLTICMPLCYVTLYNLYSYYFALSTERTWFDYISLLIIPCITIMWQIKKPWTLNLDQVVNLQALPPEEADPALALLCPVRALRQYTDRTQSFRTSEQLFVCYGGQQKGKAVSKQRMAHWIVDAITLAYEAQVCPARSGCVLTPLEVLHRPGRWLVAPR